MNKDVEQLLDTVPVGAMATVNRDRTPLVSPLHFAVLGDAIIWMSSRASRHAQNAIRSGRVNFVVWNDKKQGVFLHTTALILPEERLEEAYAAFARKHGNFRPKSDDIEVYISPIGTLDENSTTQNMWHFVA